MNPKMGLEMFKYEGNPKRMMRLGQNNFHIVETLGQTVAAQ